MNSPFLNLFPGLTEDKAIELLEMPVEQLKEKYHRYLAAAHLVNFPTERSINALIKVLQDPNPVRENRQAQRKAVESLGRLKVDRAIEVMRPFLADSDRYMVENTVWAIGEIGTSDETILSEITQLLAKEGQVYRVMIQTLAKLNYKPAVNQIAKFTDSEDPAIACAAIAAVCKLSRERTQINRVVQFLQSQNIHARRGAIQDLMDLQYYQAIPQIATTPVSQSMRLRGMRFLADEAVSSGTLQFPDIESSLDLAIWDHPHQLNMVYAYASKPSLEKVLEDLYNTNFAYCYLASKAMLDFYPDAGKELEQSFHENAQEDYGAHYHIIKLFGWLKYAPAYDLEVDTLINLGDKFVKSRIAAAISLGNLGDVRAIPHLKACLETKVWKLKYACLLALDCLGDEEGRKICASDDDWLVQAKATVGNTQ
ncbi:HEAT repeat domain-containing protein [Calothrix rhizosoleniae]|uniref:HEAT repeat domain-containing protein n=1 Tax=Calothrix rhizosoleniae TaxID=888997 RepID=UPI000B49FD99|nr:HEAT repeat domain-containing protein [Calothrix rhizosoleniae]